MNQKNEVKYYLKACDIFVFPSLKEGSPNSVLEAMAAGKPVLCSDITPHREIIEQGKNGIIFKNLAELNNSVEKLSGNPKFISELGKAAQRYVRTHHNIRDSAAQYIKLYNSFLAK